MEEEEEREIKKELESKESGDLDLDLDLDMEEDDDDPVEVLEKSLGERKSIWMKDHPDVLKILVAEREERRRERQHIKEEVAFRRQRLNNAKDVKHDEESAKNRRSPSQSASTMSAATDAHLSSKKPTKSEPQYLYQQLCMSPAIDLSILRQAAIAYEFVCVISIIRRKF